MYINFWADVERWWRINKDTCWQVQAIGSDSILCFSILNVLSVGSADGMINFAGAS